MPISPLLETRSDTLGKCEVPQSFTHIHIMQCEKACYFPSRMFNNCTVAQLLTCGPKQL